MLWAHFVLYQDLADPGAVTPPRSRLFWVVCRNTSFMIACAPCSAVRNSRQGHCLQPVDAARSSPSPGDRLPARNKGVPSRYRAKTKGNVAFQTAKFLAASTNQYQAK